MANDNSTLKPWDSPGMPGRMNPWPDAWRSSEDEIRERQKAFDQAREQNGSVPFSTDAEQQT